MVKIGDNETKKLLFFQQVTGAAARDCIDEEDMITFVASKGEIGKAIGKEGKNINILEKLLKKKINIIEYSEDATQFVGNIFFPTKVNVSKVGDKILLKVNDSDRKYIIGKGGKKIKLARELLKRHFGIDNLKLMD